MTAAGGSRAEQFQPGPRPIAPARGWLPAPTLKLHRPPHRDALISRGMQRPGRVVKTRPAERAQVCAAGQDDAVHVVVTADRADGDGRYSRHVADPVRERGLITPPKARFLVGDGLAGGDVDRIHSVSCESPRHLDRVFGAQSALKPVYS